MPNHIDNNVIIIADTELVTKIRNEIRATEIDSEMGEVNPFDFDRVIKMPDELVGTTSPTKIISQEEYDKNQKRKTEILEILEKQTTPKQHGLIEYDKQLNEEELKELRHELSWECTGITIQMSSLYKKKYGTDNWYNWNIKNWGCKWNAYSGVNGYNNEPHFFFQTAWSHPEAIFKHLSKKYPEALFICNFADEDTGSNCGIIAYKNGESEYHDPESICINHFSTAFAIGVNYGEYAEEQVEQMVDDECVTRKEADEIIKILQDNHPMIVGAKDLGAINVEMFTSQINF